MLEEKQAWLEAHLRKAGYGALLPNQATKFEDLAYMRQQYADIQTKPAFKDFLHRITQARDGFMENIVRGGGLDKWGNNHDDEIRAVLHCLNTILGYIPAIEADFAKAEKNLQRLSEAGKINPRGRMTAPAHDFWS